MEMVILLYNILIIIFFAAVATLAYVLYLKDKIRNKVFLVIALLYIANICDNTIIYMTELIDWFSKRYDAQFMAVPVFKTLILLSYSIGLMIICNLTLKRKHALYQDIVLIALGLYLMFIPLFPNSALKVWLYYLPCQLYQFWLALSCLGYIKENPEVLKGYKYVVFKKILEITVVFSILIVIEDSIVIFFVDIYSDLMIRINNRNLSEDALSVIYCIFMLKYFISSYINGEKEGEYSEEITILGAEDSARDSKEEAEKEKDIVFEVFCMEYILTVREKEILELLLAHMSNQDICESLHISIGTVKTHVHNIFVKIGVAKRNQLLRVYHEFHMSRMKD